MQGEIPDVLLLLEHPHVYTMGRKGSAREILDAEAIAQRGADVVETDRGGKITYHGPGQIVGYPIVHLGHMGGDVVQYVRRLEQALIAAVGRFGIVGEAIPGLSGVWVGRDKLAAIGVKVASSVTMHGFALNWDPDLGYFQLIIPCGIADHGVASMRRILGSAPDYPSVLDALEQEFARTFGCVPRPARPGELPA